MKKLIYFLMLISLPFSVVMAEGDDDSSPKVGEVKGCGDNDKCMTCVSSDGTKYVRGDDGKWEEDPTSKDAPR